MANIFGCRLYDVEDDPDRHYALKYGLQPANKNILSFVELLIEKREEQTVFPLAGAGVTDR